MRYQILEKRSQFFGPLFFVHNRLMRRDISAAFIDLKRLDAVGGVILKQLLVLCVFQKLQAIFAQLVV